MGIPKTGGPKGYVRSEKRVIDSGAEAKPSAAHDANSPPARFSPHRSSDPERISVTVFGKKEDFVASSFELEEATVPKSVLLMSPCDANPETNPDMRVWRVCRTEIGPLLFLTAFGEEKKPEMFSRFSGEKHLEFGLSVMPGKNPLELDFIFGVIRLFRGCCKQGKAEKNDYQIAHANAPFAAHMMPD